MLVLERACACGTLNRMDLALPAFAYHPDPVSTGSLARSAQQCERCEAGRGFVYAGPIYSAREIKSLCPWCIADGSAARAFDAQFSTVDGAPSDVPAAILDEIVHRTPGFAGWQQERWLFHCSDGTDSTDASATRTSPRRTRPEPSEDPPWASPIGRS